MNFSSGLPLTTLQSMPVHLAELYLLYNAQFFVHYKLFIYYFCPMRFLLSFFFSLILTTSKSYCQNGSLDLTFGNGGKVLTYFSTGPDDGYAIAIQSDGKIVLAGYAYFSTGYEFAVAAMRRLLDRKK